MLERETIMARLVKGDKFPDFKVNTIYGADLVVWPKGKIRIASPLIKD